MTQSTAEKGERASGEEEKEEEEENCQTAFVKEARASIAGREGKMH